jgi:hypothetical protein
LMPRAPGTTMPALCMRSGGSMREKPENLYCTFCGKAPREVRKLIAGPRVCICDECIKKCNDIIAEEAMKPAREDPPRQREKPSSPALCCSFCGRQQHEVQRLIAGPSVYICDECIGLCNDIIAEDIDRAETAAAPLATLPQNARALIAGVLNRGVPAAARIRAVLQERVTEDSVNRVADGEPRNERIRGPWHFAGDWNDLHDLVKAASEENESDAADGLAARSSGASSGGSADIPTWVPPIVERLSGTLEVLDVLARRIAEPSLEDLRPSLDLAREKLREARELLLAGRPDSPIG